MDFPFCVDKTDVDCAAAERNLTSRSLPTSCRERMLLGYVVACASLRDSNFKLRSTRRVRLSDCVDDDDDTVLSKLVRRIIVRFLRARLQPWFISTISKTDEF